MPKKKKKQIVSTKTQLLVATGVVLLLVVSGLFIGWLDKQVSVKFSTKATTTSYGNVTIKGESTCLKHKGDGPHTMECAIGIKTESGDYALSGEITPGADNQIEVTGTLTAPDKDEKYDILGKLTIEP